MREAEADPAGGPDGDPVTDEEHRSATHATVGSAVTAGSRTEGAVGRSTREHSGLSATEAARTGLVNRSSTCSGVRRDPAVPVVRVMRAGSESQPRYGWVIPRAADPTGALLALIAGRSRPSQTPLYATR